MTLAELDPQWIHPNVFTFLCPHCRKWRLSCKNVVMGEKAQWEIFEQAHPDLVVVASRSEFAWKFVGRDFATLSVTPSIDASAAGCWHGFITNGEIK